MDTRPQTPTPRGIPFTYEPWWDSTLSPVPFSLEGYNDDDLIAYVVRTQQTFFDVDLLEYVAMVGPRGGIYLDVGANIGNHSVFFATFCASHVVAFEPNPELQRLLENNLRRNGVADRATVVPVGLSATEETGSMEIRSEHRDNIGASHVARGSQRAGAGHVVSLRPLDAVLSELVAAVPALPIQFIKIDVEGMEMDVLRGSTETLRHHRPQVLVELITEDAAAQASAFLKPFGYEAVASLGNPPSHHFIDPQRHTLRPNKWVGQNYWSHMVHVTEQELRAVTPDDAGLIVADADELGASGTLAGRRKMPFLEREGNYCVHPSSGAEAIEELERLRAAGGTFFVLAWPVFWYFDVLRDFERHLRSRYACVHASNRVIVFRL